jgi:hypothetical protein
MIRENQIGAHSNGICCKELQNRVILTPAFRFIKCCRKRTTRTMTERLLDRERSLAQPRGGLANKRGDSTRARRKLPRL